MLTIRLAKFWTLRNVSGSSGRWLYLGKSASLRRSFERFLGSSNHFDVTDRFHRICQEMRQPFLDFVAAVGQLQDDRLGWFSSTFGWKDPDASDLYLLICYLRTVESLASERANDQPLLVVLEDRWLYEQCKRSLSHLAPDIDFGPTALLWPSKFASVIRAIASRAKWVVAIVREYAFHSVHKARYRIREWHACWLYSLPYASCFEGQTGWNDPFLGKLDTILDREGHSVGRLIPVDPVGFAKELARRASYVYPMILELSASRLIKSLLAFWRAHLKPLPEIGGLNISLLASREWWTDLGHASWCHYRLFYECLLVAMKKYRPEAVIFPYENQPWEKVLVSAAKVAGVGSIGYQHSTVPKLFLSNFFGKSEAMWLPLPDFILTAGHQQERLLIDGGTPPEKVAVGGSLRYEDRFRTKRSRQAPVTGGTSAKRVLVVTAHDLSLASSLLEAIDRAFPDREKTPRLSFFYRPHPTLQPTEHQTSSWMTIVKGDLAPQLETFDVVITTGTTVGLEACFLGIPTVKYQADVLLDLDPLDALPDDAFMTASSARLGERVREAALLGIGEMSRTLSIFVEELFPAVNPAVWSSVVSRTTARREIRVPPTEEVHAAGA